MLELWYDKALLRIIIGHISDQFYKPFSLRYIQISRLGWKVVLTTLTCAGVSNLSADWLCPLQHLRTCHGLSRPFMATTSISRVCTHGKLLSVQSLVLFICRAQEFCAPQ